MIDLSGKRYVCVQKCSIGNRGDVVFGCGPLDIEPGRFDADSLVFKSKSGKVTWLCDVTNLKHWFREIESYTEESNF